jgi:hypothetical protein
MSDDKLSDAEISNSINKLTDIYALKKDQLINLCISKKLNISGKVNKDLRPRLVRYFRGILKINDIDDSLDEEEKNLVIKESIENKIDTDKIEKQLESNDFSPDSDNNSNFNIFSDNFNESQHVLDSLNSNLSKIDEDIKNIFDNSNNLYYNNLEEIKNGQYNNIIEFKEPNSPNVIQEHIYEDIKYNNSAPLDHSKQLNLGNNIEKVKIIQQSDNFNNSNIQNNYISNNMNNTKMLIYKPDHFSGLENVRKFFKEYNKAGEINGWTDTDKVKFLSIFLKDTASTFLDNLEGRNNNLTWNEIETQFLDEFQPVGSDTILRTKLENRRQEDLESVTSFVNDIESLCRQLNSKITEEEICIYILRGLKEGILNAISMQDNSTLSKLKGNLRKFELTQFRINNRGCGSNDYKELLNKHVTKIEHFDIEKELKIAKLQMELEYNKKEINKLSEELKQIHVLEKYKNKNVNFDTKKNNYSRDDKYENSFNENKYRDESPYPGRMNYRSRESSLNRDYYRGNRGRTV